ncbi:sensor histidine kinase [Paenibacillus sp. CGMCC 1.16610]|uniref:histidine kinase n=1 Tax=Paenibacillus anseongense TaxID=2682845 RepID=A0ABW9UAW5_9BACL|nr:MULTISPECIES: sensor histidine kinase [Paenibacillus]MBA2937316.1 sensor histidine kinase [Paenibacillus sp. CGMCC 1.16610]MVQ36374.1 HAMP domain-containing protein [Paenibacillus anseongense]
MKIRTKIIVSTAAIVSISLLVSSFITYTYVARIIREQSVRDNQTKLAQISSSITRVQERLAKTAEIIIVDPGINGKMVPNESLTNEQQYFRKYDVQQMLQRFRALNSSLLNIMIVRPDGEIFSNNIGYESYFREYLTEDWIRPFFHHAEPAVYSVPHKLQYSNGTYSVISYVSPYLNMQDTGETKPYFLILESRLDEFERIFENSSKDFAWLRLLNGQDQTIYDSRAMGSAMKEVPSTARMIPMEDVSMLAGWRQEAYISEEQLYEKIRPILLFYLLIGMASLAFILLVMLPSMIRITKPIIVMTRAMRRLSAGELNTAVTIRSGDEMELLGNGFNRMAKDLQIWMESAMREQELKRSIQINLLLSEINPHFLYNTLNTVIYLSQSEKNKDVITITKALIDILQDTIKTGEDAYFTTVRAEADIITKYAAIQQYRYPNRFRLQWSFGEGTMECIIPRMIIQPIVENALFHGVFANEDIGIIQIEISLVGEELQIVIQDNGCGMSGEKMSTLFTKSRSSDLSNQTKGIGLANIMERIEFHYGPPYGVELASTLGQGTTVVLRLPIQM